MKSIARCALCFLAFFAAMVTVSRGIQRALPFPDVPMVRAKVEHLKTLHDQYDTLIVGSSRLAYQIIPSQFDKLMAEGGHPTRTFNAAVAGMYPPEDGYMLEKILQDPPKNLRMVILELAFLRNEVNRERGTVRSVYWRDWTRTSLICRRAFHEKFETKKKLPLKQRIPRLWEAASDVCEHAELFAEQSLNMGRGAEWVEQWLRLSSPRSTAPLNEAFDGWVPTGRSEEMSGTELLGFEKGLADRRVQPSRRDAGDDESQEALEQMIVRVEKLGAKVVLIAPPTTARRTMFPRNAAKPGPIILEYSDLAKYPALYARENRLDTDHLNEAGSRIWTGMIAEELLGYLKPTH